MIKSKRLVLPFALVLALLMFYVGCPPAGILPGPAGEDVSIIVTVPVDEASGVAVNSGQSATFSAIMDADSIDAESFTLSSGGEPVPGAVNYAGTTATFSPISNLAFSTLFVATVTTAASALDGNQMVSDRVWSFTTAVEPDVTPPTVLSTFPAESAVDVSVENGVTATFSEAVASSTISGTPSAFTLEETSGAVAVVGSATIDGLIGTFTPSASLVAGTGYTARISTQLEDVSGNHMAAEYSWSFTTAGVRPVMLRSAGDFVVLAKTGVTVGDSATIHGKIGLNALATSFVGFAQVMDQSGTFSRAASPLIPGNLYAQDYADDTPAYLATAIDDLAAAYEDAAGREDWTDLGSGELGGRTLAPGVYRWGAAVAITTDLILDGDPADTYIFQIGGALTMAASVQVALPNGALPQNIVWRTAGAVALGASGVLPGIVLSDAAITLGASTRVNGRLYASTIETLAATVSVLEPAP